MAESAITRQSVISDDALQAPLVLAKNMEVAIQAAKDFIATTQSSKGKILDTESINEAKDSVKKLGDEQKVLASIQKQIETATAKNSEKYIEQTKVLKNLKNELKTKTALGERDSLQINKTNASIEELNAALAKNRASYAQLRTEEQRTSKEGKALLAVIQQQDADYKSLRESMGQNQDSVGDYSKATRDLKEQLKALKGEMIGLEEGSDAYIEAANKAGKLTDKISEIGENIKAQSGGTAIERFGANFDVLGSKIRNLDFEGANQQIKNLNVISKQMTFKEAINGVGGFGKGMAGLAKAIFTNPLFILAAVVLGVGIAIYKLRDSITPLRIALDFLGDTYDYIIDKLKEFSDWLGISTFKDDEATRKSIENGKKRRQNAEFTADLLIKIAEAQGKETLELEIKKDRAIIAANRKTIADLQRLGEKRTEDESKMLDELLEENVKLGLEIYVLEQTRTANAKKNAEERKKAEQDALFELQKFRLEQQIKEQELIINNDQQLYQKRLDASVKAEELRDQLVFLIRAKEVKDAEGNNNKILLAREQANAAIVENDRKAAEERDKIAQDEINRLATYNETIQNDITKSYEERVNAAIVAGNLRVETEEQIAQRILKIQQDLLAEEQALFEAKQNATQTYYNDQLAALDASFSSQEIGVKEYEKRRADLERENNAKSVDNQADFLKAKIEDFKKYGMDTTALEKQLSDVNLAEARKSAEARLAFERDLQNALIDLKNTAVSSALTIIDNFNAAEDERRAMQLEKLNKDRELELELAGNNEAAKAAIVQKFAIEEDRIRREQAEADRRRAIFEKATAALSIGVNTAQAILKAVAASPLTGGLPFSAIAAGIGAVQLAAVLAKPIPQYKDGIDSHPGGLAVLGDGYKSELAVTPSGQLLLSPDKPTLMDLPAGTEVFNGEETMALALAGLLGGGDRQSSSQEAEEFKMLRKDLKSLTKTIKNKREVHLNFSRRGAEAVLQKAESRQYFLNSFYQ
jgi:hypothetical protein